MTRRLRVLRTLVARLGFLVGRLRRISPHVVLASSHSAALDGNLAWIRIVPRRGLITYIGKK